MSEIYKSEYCAAIKFFTLEKQLANNIYERLVNIYGDSDPSNVAEHRLKLDGQLKRPSGKLDL